MHSEWPQGRVVGMLSSSLKGSKQIPHSRDSVTLSQADVMTKRQGSKAQLCVPKVTQRVQDTNCFYNLGFEPRAAQDVLSPSGQGQNESTGVSLLI